jgi:hypothetical protein
VEAGPRKLWDAVLQAAKNVIEWSSVRLRNSTIIVSSTGVSIVLLGLRGPMGAFAVVARDLHFVTVVRLRP